MKKHFLGLVVAAMMATVMPVEAKYGGSRSVSSTRVYSAPRPSYTAPRTPSYTAPRVPTYRAPQTPVYRSNTTTVINQRSGGGFFSNMLSTGAGVLGGMALFNWLKGDTPPAPAPAAVAPAVPASAPVVTK